MVSKHFEIFCEASSTSAQLEWPENRTVDFFVFIVRDAFSISDDLSFLLADEEGDVVALSSHIPSGRYSLQTNSSGANMQSIIQSRLTFDDVSGIEH